MIDSNTCKDSLRSRSVFVTIYNDQIVKPIYGECLKRQKKDPGFLRASPWCPYSVPLPVESILCMNCYTKNHHFPFSRITKSKSSLSSDPKSLYGYPWIPPVMKGPTSPGMNDKIVTNLWNDDSTIWSPKLRRNRVFTWFSFNPILISVQKTK